MHYSVAAFVAGILALTAPVLAQSSNVDTQKVEDMIIDTKLPSCKHPETRFDAAYCYGKIYFIADEFLNTAYQDAKQALSQSNQAKLRGAQTAWRLQRDKSCIEVRSGGDILELECAFEATLGSAWFLIDLKENPLRADQILDDYYAWIDDI